MENDEPLLDRDGLKELLSVKSSYITGRATKSLIVTQDIYLSEEVLFDQCVFEGDISFEEINIGKKLTFNECIFKRGLDFFNCKGLLLEDGRSLGIALSKCKCEKLRIEGCELQGILIYGNKTSSEEYFVNKLSITDTIVNGHDIRIGLGAVGDTNLKRLKIRDNLAFRKSVFKGRLNIVNCQMSSLTIIESQGNERILVKESIFNGQIDISESKFFDYISFNDINCSGALELTGCEFTKTLLITRSIISNTINDLSIASCKFLKGVLMGPNSLANVAIICSNDLSGNIDFDQCNIINLEISGNNHNASINFSRSFFGRIVFQSFYNQSVLSLSSCKSIRDVEVTEFIVLNSDLGKSRFLDFSFASFSKLIISHSLFAEILTIGVEWFQAHQLKFDASLTKIERCKRIKEVFRQLRQASDKQGDNLQAINFRALELEAFKSESLAAKKSFLDNDHLILLLSKTNSFGLNWKKPIVWAACCTVFFYIPIVVCLSEKISWVPSFYSNDIKVTLKELIKYHDVLAQLFNPTHNLRTMIERGAHTAVYWWDGLHRIVLAFFIIQVVSAFRKFIKSS